MKSLSQYADLIWALKESFVSHMTFHSEPNLKEILENPRLIIAMNHSTPLSWLPAITVLSYEMIQAGHPSRVVRGVMDRWFYNNPLTRKLAGFLTQFDQPQTFEELLTTFQKEPPHDMIIFPEGANTFFGDPSQIQEFRSSRFIELALRSGSPILIAVHKGSESWSLPLPIAKEWGEILRPYTKFFGDKMTRSKNLNLPLWPHKLPSFEMICEIYQPELKLEDLSDHPEKRRLQLDQEAERVRQRMAELLPGAKKSKSTKSHHPRSKQKTTEHKNLH